MTGTVKTKKVGDLFPVGVAEETVWRVLLHPGIGRAVVLEGDPHPLDVTSAQRVSPVLVDDTALGAGPVEPAR